MKRSDRIKLLDMLFKESIFDPRQDLGAYLRRIQELMLHDLSDSRVQHELQHLTNIAVERYEEGIDEQPKVQRPIGFRPARLRSLEKLFKLSSIIVQDPVALERKIRSYAEKAVQDLLNDPDIMPLIERLPADDKNAIQDGLYGLDDIMHALLLLLEHDVESSGGDFTYQSKQVIHSS